MWPQGLDLGTAYWLMCDFGQVDFNVPVPQSAHRYLGDAVSSKQADLYDAQISAFLGASSWSREQASAHLPFSCNYSFLLSNSLSFRSFRSSSSPGHISYGG